MAVTCASCGEELLGAVNRCWKCGAMLVSRPGDTALPPVRRAPVDLRIQEPVVVVPPGERAASLREDEDGVLLIGLDDDEIPSPAAEQRADAKSAEESGPRPSPSPPADREEPVEAVPLAANDAAPPVRRGSPFAAQTSARLDASPAGAPRRPDAPQSTPAAPRRFSAAPLPAGYAANPAATGGAVAAVTIGVLSLIGAFFFPGVAFTALLGIGLGAWGLFSEHRWTALIGIAICVLAIIASAGVLAFSIYVQRGLP